MKHFSVKNFERFQHYKDRAPPWIKLYNELLDDYEFGALPDATKMHLIAIWLLASRSENKIPFDPAWVSRRINANEAVNLDLLLEHGFILIDQELQTMEHVASIPQAKRLSREEGEGEDIKQQSRACARAEISTAEKVLRTDLAEAFGPSRVVDLSRAGLWLSKGYVSSMILEVVRELLARKPDISSLNYFDAALADRYQRWNAAPQIGDQPSLEDYERAAALFVKDNSKWGNRMGPEPGMGGCRCPTEILIRHGINPKTGLRMQ